MKARVEYWWDQIQSSYWFIPSALTCGAVAAAVLLPSLDYRINPWFQEKYGWLGVSASSAQSILSSIAGAMVTVAGVVFSITMVILSIASSQLGPRLLRTVMSDRPTHWSLGLFVATSLYCFLVLASIRSNDAAQFVPQVSTGIGVAAAVVCMGGLIFFIHNMAQLMQAPQVIAEVAQDLDQAIERLYPQNLGKSVQSTETNAAVEEKIRALGAEVGRVRSIKEGYIQGIDEEAVLKIAAEQDVVIELFHCPGRFLVKDADLARYWKSSPSRDFGSALNACFLVGNRPTPRQDIACGVSGLVEIAMRGLSPGINDPITACNCLDRLAASLGRLSARRIPSALRYDADNYLRVIARPFPCDKLIHDAFDAIQCYGGSSPLVMEALVQSLETIGRRCRNEAMLDAVRDQIERAEKVCDREDYSPWDQARIRNAAEAARMALGVGT